MKFKSVLPAPSAYEWLRECSVILILLFALCSMLYAPYAHAA
jgi:hypothetical protein